MWGVIVLAVILGLISLFILALCIPVDAIFEWDSSVTRRPSVRLTWLFGLVSRDLSRGGGKPKTRAKRARRRPDFGTIVELWREGLFQKVLKLMKDVLRQIRLKELLVDVRVGFDNPVNTGLLCAIAEPIAYFLGQLPRCTISFKPSFTEDVFEGRVHGVARLQPVRLLPGLARFAFSRSTFRAMRVLASSR